MEQIKDAMFFKKYSIIFLFGIIFSCNSPDSSKPIVIPPYVATEFNKYDIQPIGPYIEIDDSIPDTLSSIGSPWPLYNSFCMEGGYNLAAHAGHRVKFLGYPINEHYVSAALNVWAITDSNECACVYKAVRAGSTLTPGIFSVNDTSVKKN